MPWIFATTDATCNRCHCTMASGAQVWRGQYASYCPLCAETMGLDGNRPVTVDTKVAALSDWLKAMQAKHGRRDLSARMIGEDE